MQKAFDGSRKDLNAAIDRICEFTGKSYSFSRSFPSDSLLKSLITSTSGTKIVFWDLREPIIENLYKPSVSQARLESLVEPLDVVGFSFKIFI